MKNRTHALVLTALFTALTAIGAFLKLPLGVTWVSLQFLFTVLAGMILGPKWGAASQLVYMVLGLAGLPVFTKGGGPGYLLEPSMGFVLGLTPCAWLAGLLTGKGELSFGRAVTACLAGLGALYLVGIPYLYTIFHLYREGGDGLWEVVKTGMLVYLPGDLLKTAAAAAVAPYLRRVLKRI